MGDAAPVYSAWLFVALHVVCRVAYAMKWLPPWRAVLDPSQTPRPSTGTTSTSHAAGILPNDGDGDVTATLAAVPLDVDAVCRYVSSKQGGRAACTTRPSSAYHRVI